MVSSTATFVRTVWSIVSPLVLLASIASTAVLSSRAQADALDDYVKAQMEKHGVPGLSLAIVDGGKIVETRCYGVLEKGTRRRVTPTTLFQAGSISKTVAAVGALRLVEQGVLSLDEDVNVKLRTWKVPENEFTKDQKVTLRRLLSHSAGMTVHGFPGYATDAPLPSLVQVLNGETPANTPPIRVEKAPGTVWNYSGGGYTVMQQLVLDVTGQAFPEFMEKAVLEPAGMTDSSYAQPQPKVRAARTAAGTYANGDVVKGRWHLYPEMAAAGLWTTPTDLAKFVISIQHAYAGEPTGVLSQAMAVQMLTDQKSGDGLGAFLAGKEATLRFSHSGRDEGFDADYIGYARTGQGVAVMINANENTGMVGRIIRFIAGQAQWPDFPRLRTPSTRTVAHINAMRMEAIAGYYATPDQQTLIVTKHRGRLVIRAGGSTLDELLPQGNNRFYAPDLESYIAVVTDGTGAVTGLTVTGFNGENHALNERICGALAKHPVATDPDPKRAEIVKSFCAIVGKGGDPIATATYLTPGAQKDFRGGTPDLNGLEAMEYLGENDVADRDISRHGSKVVHVVEYRIRQSGATRDLLVFFADHRQITDFDVVEE